MFINQNEMVVIRSNGMNHLVRRSDVIWIKAKGERTELRTTKGYLDCPYRFLRATEKFHELPFTQINRSTIINLNFLEAYSDTWEEIKIEGNMITVANGCRDQLKEWCSKTLM